MKTLLLGLLLLFSTLYSTGQTQCGTPTDFPNTFPSYNWEQGSYDETPICVRVFFHIVRNSAGSNGFNQNNIPALLNILNEAFMPRNIIIVNSGVDFINNDAFGIEFNDSEFTALTNTNNVTNAINFYLLPINATGYAGRASAIPGNSLVVGFDFINTSTSPHELGHCLNLFHTHHQVEQGGCSDNGTNCTTCGDFVCDTPVDPVLSCGTNVDPGTCAYTGGGGFNPDTRNYMSYSCRFPPCRDRFSVGQGVRMRVSLLNDPLLQPFITTACVTMEGSKSLCSTSATETYTIQNAPPNSTFAWSWSNNCPTYTPNGSQCTVTRGNCSGSTTLTCTITTPFGNLTVSKDIALANAPNEYSFVPYITHGTSTTYMSNYCNKLTYICTNSNKSGIKEEPPVTNIISPNNYCASGYITDASATSITWSVEQKSPGTFHGYYNFNGNQFNVGINVNYPNEWIILKCTRTNACGSFSHSYKFYANNYPCLAPPSHCAVFPNDPGCAVEAKQNLNVQTLNISPNPSNGSINIQLHTEKSNDFIKEVVILSKLGRIIFHEKYKSKNKNMKINVSVPTTDIYILKVYDGSKWHNTKVSLVK